MAEKKSKRPKKPAPFLERTPLLEWLMAGAGLVATVGAIGYFAWQGARADDRFPLLSSRAASVVDTRQGYVVNLEVANDSRVTASAVQVQGLLPAEGGEQEEEVTLTFDYVPAQGRREGSMVFQRDPRSPGFSLQVKGQVAP